MSQITAKVLSSEVKLNADKQEFYSNHIALTQATELGDTKTKLAWYNSATKLEVDKEFPITLSKWEFFEGRNKQDQPILIMRFKLAE